MPATRTPDMELAPRRRAANIAVVRHASALRRGVRSTRDPLRDRSLGHRGPLRNVVVHAYQTVGPARGGRHPADDELEVSCATKDRESSPRRTDPLGSIPRIPQIFFAHRVVQLGRDADRAITQGSYRPSPCRRRQAREEHTEPKTTAPAENSVSLRLAKRALGSGARRSDSSIGMLHASQTARWTGWTTR